MRHNVASTSSFTRVLSGALAALVVLFPFPVAADHTPGPDSVTIAGSLQEELGCPGDWQPDCVATFLGFDAEDNAWQAEFDVPAGMWEYKAALNGSWDENYGLGAVRDGANIPLDLAAEHLGQHDVTDETENPGKHRRAANSDRGFQQFHENLLFITT